MTDLAEFLLARIAEDERVWGSGAFAPVAGQGLSRLILKTRAECDAKRRIVQDQSGGYTWRDDLPELPAARNWPEGWVEVSTDGDTWTRMSEAKFLERYMQPSPPSLTLRLLALPYADHPDYREEWQA